MHTLSRCLRAALQLSPSLTGRGVIPPLTAVRHSTFWRTAIAIVLNYVWFMYPHNRWVTANHALTGQRWQSTFNVDDILHFCRTTLCRPKVLQYAEAVLFVRMRRPIHLQILPTWIVYFGSLRHSSFEKTTIKVFEFKKKNHHSRFAFYANNNFYTISIRCVVKNTFQPLFTFI